MDILKKLFNKPKVEEKSFNYLNNGIVLDYDNSFYFTGLYQDDKLIQEGYSSNTDAYAIIKKLCEVSSSIPFVVEKLEGDEWVVDKDSALNNLLEQPNEKTNGKDFRFNTMLYLLNTGDWFWRPLVSGFNLTTELHLLPSNLVEIQTGADNLPSYYEYNRLDTYTERIPISDLIHGMYLNPSVDGLETFRGLSPLQAAYNSLKASNNRLTAQAHLYENRGATNLISSGSDVTLMPSEREQLQKETDRILGGAKNFNKSIVSTKNLNVTQLGMSATDLRLIEAKDLDLRDICNAFGVPSTLFNDQAASTLDNLKIGRKLMYEDAVIPNNEKLLSKINESIVPAYSTFENKTLRVCQDISGIEALQEDELTKVQKQSTEVSTILSISNDSSLKENQKQSLIEGLGYEYVTPKEEPVNEGVGTGNSEVQMQSLNGSQVTSMVTIVQSVAEGTMPKESAIGILMASYGMTEAEAGKIINPI